MRGHRRLLPGLGPSGSVAACLTCAASPCHVPDRRSPFADVEVFYDVEHPPVFLHLRDPTADDAPEPPASQVLLRSDATPQAGYAAAGLLHAGSGYWAPEQPLPVPSLADHSVVAVGNSLFILGGNMPSSEVSLRAGARLPGGRCRGWAQHGGGGCTSGVASGLLLSAGSQASHPPARLPTKSRADCERSGVRV